MEKLKHRGHDDGSCFGGVGRCECGVVSSVGQGDYLRASRLNHLRDLKIEAEQWEIEEIEADLDSDLSARIVELQTIVDKLFAEAFPEGRPPANWVPTTGVSAPPES